MDERQTLAAQALREPPALSPDVFTRPDGGSARSARPRLTHAIMADRAVAAAAEIAMLKQKLAAAEARIREIEDKDKDNGFKPFTWWKSDKTKRLQRPTNCGNAWLHSIVKLRSGLGSDQTNNSGRGRNYFSARLSPSAGCGHSNGPSRYGPIKARADRDNRGLQRPNGRARNCSTR
jgi:hypothetical protein